MPTQPCQPSARGACAGTFAPLLFDLARAGHLGQRTQHTQKTVHFVVPWAAKKKSPPENTASSLQNHKIQTAALQIKRRNKQHPGTQTTSWWCILGHTHQHQHTLHCYSSIQAPFCCPANPALVVHALERLRLCCSILPVRGIWDNELNTHKKHFTSWCPGLRNQNPLPKIPPRPYKTITFKRPSSNQTALRTPPWHANNLAPHTAHPLSLSTSQRTPHTLYFYPSSDTPRSAALRSNFCASAV